MANILDIRKITPRSNPTRKISEITHIARHHSGGDTGDFQTFWKYWNGTKGWNTGGYHEIILRDGSVQLCYDPEEVTNGVGNHNTNTYHICVVGNGSFTDAQERTWEERVLYNLARFKLPVDKVWGHKEFKGASTACPGISMGVVRNRLIYLLSSKEVKPKEMIRMLKPSTDALKDGVVIALNNAVKEGILSSSEWAKKADEGKLPLDDAIALSLLIADGKKRHK